MANRYPLVLDTTDGNKIKELPEGDNLYLRTNSIEEVQNINALGTINAANITIGGQTLQAQTILDLTDTPSSFVGAANQVLKVKSTEDGIDFVDIADLGDLTAGNITLTGDIVPDQDNVSNLGTNSKKYSEVRSYDLYGNLRGYDGTLVFDADTSQLLYGALVGAPTSLSEFTNDAGYVTINQVSNYLENNLTISDFRGSVFSDDSTILVDGVAGRLNPAAIFGEFGGEVSGPSFRTPELINQTDLLITTDGPFLTQTIDIQPGGTTSFVNIISPNIQFLGEIVNRIQLEEGADVKNGITGDLTGSVYYDDSTQIIDAVAGRIVNPVVSGTATFEDNVNINQDLLITGNLTVQGTTTSVETTNTTVTDNVIVLNNGEAGAGVTAGTSGIEIDRGSEANKTLVWDDSVDKWSVGTETIIAATFEGDLTGDVTGNVTGNLTGPVYDNLGLSVLLDNEDGTFRGSILANDGEFLLDQYTKTLNADVVGSVFADDSSVMVDAINNQIVADKVITPLIEGPSNAVGIVGSLIALGSSHSITANAGPVTISSDNSSVILTGANGFGSISYNDANGNIDLGTTGVTTIQGAAGAAINIGTGTSGTVTLGNGTNTVGFTSGTTIDFNGATINNFTGNISGDVTGNIDNTTLNIGIATATAINIGNENSAIVMDGTLQLNSALIVNNLVADNSISITTADGDGNAISLGPQGTNTFINFTADNIRFFGPVTTNIDALGGITGDVVGSVFSDNSSVMVDAINNHLVADKVITPSIDSTSTLALTADANITMSAANMVYLQTLNGNFDIVATGGYVGLSDASGAGSISISDIDGSINLGTTGTTTIQGAASAAINIGSGTSGTVTLGNGSNTIDIAEGSTVDFTNVNVGSLANAIIDWVPIVTGVLVNNGLPILPTQTLDISGSVFADDSTLLIDAVNGEIVAPIRDVEVVGATDNGGSIVDTVNPAEYLVITVNGNTRYIPLFV